MKASLFLTLLLIPHIAIAETPLSVIDWLNKNSEESPNGPVNPNFEQEPATATEATAPRVAVSTLTETRVDAVGLLSPSVTGFPLSIWNESRSSDLVRSLSDLNVSNNPAIQSLLFRLLLAEGHAPYDSDENYFFLLARIEVLINYGAVEPALALLERAAPLPAQLVPSLFDISMLSEALLPACNQVIQLGSAYPNDAERIFCLARKGDWMTAHLMLEATSALKVLDKRQEHLLKIFLGAYDYAENIEEVPPPLKSSPLDFRLYEAIGRPLATSSLPLAFAVNDLSGDHGWKAQLEAADRLKTSGALADNRYLGIFTAREPAASGGIWDKVSLIQSLDKAVAEHDKALAEETITELWNQPDFKALIGPVSRLFSKSLLSMELSQETIEKVERISFLSPDYRLIALRSSPSTQQEALLKATALNDFSQFIPKTLLGAALLEAFTTSRVPYSVTALMEQHKLGETILTAIIQFEKGSAGDMQDLIDSIATLRLVGLEETARRAALYLLIIQNYD